MRVPKNEAHLHLLRAWLKQHADLVAVAQFLTTSLTNLNELIKALLVPTFSPFRYVPFVEKSSISNSS